MRKMQKTQAKEMIALLEQAHDEVKKYIETGKTEPALELLAQCQDSAIQLGKLIESTEGEGFVTISLLEHYCELLYQLYEEITQNQSVNINKEFKNLRKELIRIENSVKNDIPVRKEAVFLPYKASMWDSLESIWKAADDDPDCDAYVIPIPYYDKNRDGSFKTEHYEGDLFPDYVPITRYDSYDFAGRRPDMIFIHNPYDNYNFVTSVHPFFYSKNLKNFTDILVYVPYYSTSGGMSEAQSVCSAYYYVDYIIIQAEKYRSFFDPELPQDRLLPLGSPKFDRVINICNNPPESPDEWKEKMAGKKVYFYNTSINGMLQNTEKFLRKMEYVFRCFAGREDACLLWRPHPLLESTFDSMRAEYKPVYNKLKEYFLTNNLGIYDESPDITNTIALCDAYIGDSGTSVTSLFGIVGKPIFILNNSINTAPQKGDWRGKIIRGFSVTGNDEWIVTVDNKLYYSPKGDYKYEYYCDLSEYSSGSYYSHVITINGKNYVCPVNASDVLVVENNEIVKRISLTVDIKERGAFYGALKSGNYLFLIPNKYPAIVRYDTVNDKLDYYDTNLNVITATVNSERRIGGYCEREGYIYIGSPVSNQVLVIEAETGKEVVLTTKSQNECGCLIMQCDGKDLWLLPYTGSIVTRWNPDTGEMQEYDCGLAGLKCINPVLEYECNDKVFGYGAFYNNDIYLTPRWGNMYVKINKTTGEITEWIPPFDRIKRALNGYFTIGVESYFVHIADTECTGKIWHLFSAYDRQLYDIDFDTNDYKEINIEFDLKQLKENEAGFSEYSDWLMYACEENAFNSLSDFLDDNITGNQFDKDKQLKAYSKIAANYDGTSGYKIYEFMCGKLLD